MPSEYGREGDVLLKRRHLPELHVTLRFRASQIRMERTGVHARIEVLAAETVLAWSNFNVERDEDRVRLANSAYSHLLPNGNGSKQQDLAVYPRTHLKSDIDQFCIGLWDARQDDLLPRAVAGTLERQEPRYLLRPYVLEGGGTIIFAPPGRGKSYILMLMGVALDAGLEQFWPVRACRVLLINLERSLPSVADRLGNINEVLGLERGRRIFVQHARGRSLSDVAVAAERFIASEGIECVLVDSVSRAGLGDLNNNTAVNQIIDTLNHLCPSWVALAHTPRSDESHLYGGIHFEAGADVVVQLASEQEEGGPLGVGLQITKNNDVGKQPVWVGALEFDASGLRVARRARPGEFGEVERMRKLSMKEAIKEHLLDVGARDATQIAEELGFNRSNVSHLLATDTGLFQPAGRLGHRQLYGVRAQFK